MNLPEVAVDWQDLTFVFEPVFEDYRERDGFVRIHNWRQDRDVVRLSVVVAPSCVLEFDDAFGYTTDELRALCDALDVIDQEVFDARSRTPR